MVDLSQIEEQPGARPSTHPFGDGRDGRPLLRTVALWFAASAILLLLPRQWWAAAIAGAVAAVLWLAYRTVAGIPAQPPKAVKK